MLIPDALHLFHQKIIGKLGFSAIFVLTTAAIAAVIFDTTITNLFIFPYGTRSSALSTAIFAAIILFCVVAQLLFIRLMGLVYRKNEMFRKPSNKIIHYVVTISQCVLAIVLVFTVVEIIFTNKYDTLVSRSAIWISHVLSIGLLFFLSFRLLKWFRYDRDYIVLSYTLAVMAIAINLLVMLIYLSNEMSVIPRYVGPLRDAVGFFTSTGIVLPTAHIILDILSFFLVWSATILVLRYYSRRIGKIRFYVILSIPLIYFLSQFQTQFLDIFVTYRASNPILFSITYTLIFSASKPVGGIMAGLAFWTIAKNIDNKSVKEYMMFSVYGIMLLLTSNQAITLINSPYPPFGLATASFVGLASYSMLVGIYFSAISVAQDSKLRTLIAKSKKSVAQQLGFLSSLATSQVQEETTKKVTEIVKDLATEMEEHSGVPIVYSEQEVLQYMKTVIQEGGTSAGGSLKQAIKLFSRDDKPFGRSWEEWVELWWKWCYKGSWEESPLADKTGKLCAEGQACDEVWFLAGTFGGEAERTCVIPPKRALLFPLINDFISHHEYPQLKTELELNEYAKADLDKTRFMKAMVDKKELDNLKDYRVRTGAFSISLQSGASSQPHIQTKAVSDGYWVFLEPLPVGVHTIQFTGEKLAFDDFQNKYDERNVPIFRVSVKYHLTVM